MTILKQTLFSTALLAVLAVITAPAMAAEKKMSKEITEIVGYNVTEEFGTNAPRARLYKKMDKDGDNRVSFNTYRDYSNLDDEYGIFSEMDANRDKYLSMAEFVNFDKTKGNTEIESELFGKTAVKGTNLKTKPLPSARSYFQPTERKVVDVKNIEPAAK